MAGPIARVRRLARADVTESDVTALAPRARVSSAATSPFRRPGPRLARERFGPYMVFEQLGEGGMARVHRAELAGAAGFRKSVALKRMHSLLTDDADFVTAFVHEAQLAGRLRHPHIAQAFELGKIDGTYYIAMEYVPGPTLSQVMAQSRRAAGLVPLPIVLEILIQLLDALEHAHELTDDGGRPLDLVHRDVSPANVIVSSSGAIKLIDFGIAKDRSSRSETQAGVIKGKFAYVAPEYTYGQLDRRVDLFGVGVIAHELLTGRRLFVGKSDHETLWNVREKPIPPPSRYQPIVPHELDDVVLTAVQRDPALRWQNAGAMRAALTAIARDLGLRVSGRTIRDWTEWAFEQPARRDSDLDGVLDDLEPSVPLRAATARTVPTPRPAPVSPVPAPSAPPSVPVTAAIVAPPRRTSRLLVLVLVAVLGFAAVHGGVVDVAWWRSVL